MAESKNNNRNLLIVGGILVVLLIALFIYMFTQFLGTDDAAPEETITPFPESGLRDDLGPVNENDEYVGFVSSDDNVNTTATDPYAADNIPEELRVQATTDWREDVVNYSAPGQVSVIPTGDVPGRSVTPSGDYSISTDFILDIDNLPRTPSTVQLPNGAVIPYEDINDIDALARALQIVPSLAEEFSQVKSCGKLTMPTTDSGVEDFLDELHTLDEVACLGAAVADDCASAWLDVMTPYRLPMKVYVAERDDGVCSFGSSYSEGSADLCSITDAMNLIENDTKNFKEWMEVFAEDPGETFALLYTQLAAALSSSDTYDCVTYEI